MQANHIYSMMRLQAKITYKGVWAIDRLEGPFPEQLFGIGNSSVYELLRHASPVWHVVMVLLFCRCHCNGA